MGTPPAHPASGAAESEAVTVPGTSKQSGKFTTLSPPARLLRHADFERVYSQGRRHFSASITVFYLQRQETPDANLGLRVGFTVSRALGGAVVRNRLRRRLREAVRLSMRPDVSVDVVINPKKSLLTVDFEALRNEVRRAFVVMEKAMIERRAHNTARAKSQPEAGGQEAKA